MSNFRDVVPANLQDLYEIHDFQHAAAILSVDFPELFDEICTTLARFRFTEQWVRDPGGNESEIPKAFSRLFRPLDWVEAELEAKLVVTEKKRHKVKVIAAEAEDPDTREVKYGTHNIDYVKGRVAIDLEWNSKDQTFDRDLYAFRAFFEYGRIDVGILVTRSNELDAYFAQLGRYKAKYGVERTYMQKYGASTTHMGKLLPRMNAGRHGGCPILVFGITTKLLEEPE